MITLGLYSDPPPRKLLAVVQSPLVPRQGEVLVINDADLSADADGWNSYEVHQVVWDQSPATGGFGVNLMVHRVRMP